VDSWRGTRHADVRIPLAFSALDVRTGAGDAGRSAPGLEQKAVCAGVLSTSCRVPDNGEDCTLLSLLLPASFAVEFSVVDS
jgi:hypothetical protein